MSPFMRLSNPAICSECGKVLPRKRIALFEMCSFTCVPCAKRKRGEVPMTQDELDLDLELQAKEEDRLERI